MLPLSSPIRFGSLEVRPPWASPGQKIGLLGGSFNPAHEGHLNASLIALRRLGLDRVWWIVSPGNPLKTASRVADFEARVASAKALARDPRIIVTPFEAALPTAYTAAMLAFLQLRYPGTRFVWLMGADNLAGFHRWMDWRGILETVPIAIVDRPNCRMRAVASRAAGAFRSSHVPEAEARTLAGLRPPAWCFLTGPLSTESSTAIRARRIA